LDEETDFYLREIYVLVGEYLGPLGLQLQNTIDWGAYEQQKYISYCSGGWKSKINMPTDFGVT